jgi:hypothetical protein
MQKGARAALTIGACFTVVILAGGAAAAGQQAPPSQSGAVQQIPPPPVAPPSLAGKWELNVQASDPMSQPREPGEEGGGHRGGGRGGRGGMGGGGMGGRGGGMEGERGGGGTRDSESVQEEMRRIMEAQRVLLIVQHEANISVTDDQGRVVTLKPDGEKVKEQQAGATIERTTKWDGRSLVTQVKLSNGAHVTQTYTKVNEGLELIVATKIEGGRFPKGFEFKRVYEQALQ